MAAITLFGQSSVHFIVGGGSGSTLMAIAHLIFGVIAYLVIRQSDSIGETLLKIVRFFLIIGRLGGLPKHRFFSVLISTDILFWPHIRTSAQKNPRAPPLADRNG